MSECVYCGDDLPCGKAATIVQVTYHGSPGSYYDQPEPAEGVIECHDCQEETDGSFDSTLGYCLTGEHEVSIQFVDDEDPDDAFERAWEQRHLGM